MPCRGYVHLSEGEKLRHSVPDADIDTHRFNLGAGFFDLLYGPTVSLGLSAGTPFHLARGGNSFRDTRTSWPAPRPDIHAAIFNPTRPARR